MSFNRAQHWEPHQYQKDGIKFMLEHGAAGMFLDPGLGKTSVTLAAFEILRQQGMARTMLVIAPLRVCHMVWPSEVAKWSMFNDLVVRVLHGKHKDAELARPADIYVINPEGLPWLLGSDVLDRRWKYETSKLAVIKPDMLVIDESTKFKKAGTKRFKMLKKVLHTFSRRYCLTGTPTPNGLMDLFGQIYILDQGVALGQFITHFRRKFFTPDHTGFGWEPTPSAFDTILDLIAPFTMRLEDTDWLELPELVYNDIKVNLPAEARAIYNELEEELMAIIQETEVLVPSSAAVSIKLRQLCGGAVYDNEGKVLQIHKEKALALKELHESIGEAPLLVAYQFKHEIETIRAEFGDVPYIGSGVSTKEANDLCVGFNMGAIPVLLAHPASIGHGLNLQGRSNHVAFYGLPWDLEQYMQFIRRVRRQGNDNSHVFVHHILARSTIELAVMRALRGKDTSQSSLLNYLKSYLNEENHNG
jgi:SNF2 family DNA or RNA helicase